MSHSIECPQCEEIIDLNESDMLAGDVTCMYCGKLVDLYEHDLDIIEEESAFLDSLDKKDGLWYNNNQETE